MSDTQHADSSAHGQRQADSPLGDAAHDETEASLEDRITAAVKAALGPAVNSAVTSHLRRELPKLRDELKPAQPEADDSTEDSEASAPASQQPSRQERMLAAKMASLEKELAAAKAEREQERERLAQKERDDALRGVLEKEGVRSTSVALNALKAELKVEDGQYVHEGPDGLKTAEEYARDFLRENAYLRRPAGKEGGGSVPNERAAPARVAEGLTGVSKMAAVMKATSQQTSR